MIRASCTTICRRVLLWAPVISALALMPASLQAAAEGVGSGPDVAVIYLGEFSDLNHYTDAALPGIHAYSVGTTSCNVGTEPLWWCDENRPYCDDAQHPVIGQNLFRAKDGRFEQIGMSWLKHGFFSLNTFDTACGDCQTPPHGSDQLGVGCTDAYSANLNGLRPLGLRSEVNAATGVFPFPETQVPSPTAIDQRIRVEEADLDPALNVGARYWVEGHYVAPDDAQEGNGLNNASYREVTVQPNFDLALVGDTVREQPAIFAWQTVDAGVELVAVDVPGSDPVERFYAARRVSSGPGTWHYEYAIHNLNSDRSARRFRVQFPSSASISGVGFRDIEHHSGEIYDTKEWTMSVDGLGGTVEWSGDPFSFDENANALRWGTLFSFWFDADLPPEGTAHTLELFKPGSPGELQFDFGDAIIFGDGFESGDTSSWSSSVGD